MIFFIWLIFKLQIKKQKWKWQALSCSCLINSYFCVSKEDVRVYIKKNKKGLILFTTL